MNVPKILGYFHYRPAAWLRVTGSDAASFLQGQFTNDVRGLESGRAAYGLWLNQKGKILADSFIISGVATDEFWIESYFCPSVTFCRRLEDYIIADDVTVEDLTEGWAGSAVIGDPAGAWLASVSPRPGFVFRGRRADVETWEWVYPVSSIGEVAQKLAGCPELGSAEMERMRIEAGIPAVPGDAGSGDLPNEAGLEDAAISYTKGCYLGQEIMARLKSRGHMRRRLRRVRGTGPVPALPAALWQEGRTVGELRSAAAEKTGGEFVGLAMMALQHLRSDSPLALSTEGEATIRLA